MSDAPERLCFVNCGLPADQCACYRDMITRSDLVIRKDDPDLLALVEALRWMGAERRKHMRTADYHGDDCRCYRCAEDAVFSALKAYEALK